MQEQAKKNNKKKRALVYKPYQKGNWCSGLAVKRGLKLILYYIVFAFLYLVAGTALQFDNIILRIVCNALLMLACCAIIFMNAARVGEEEVAYGEIILARKGTDKEVSKKDLDRCFHPFKGVFVMLVAAVPLMLLLLPHALTAQLQTYSLQSLPGWVSGGFRGQSEITAPLSYYQRDTSMTFLDFLRIVSRLLNFPFVNMASPGGAQALLTVDRLSPLLVWLPAAAYPLGYLSGPRSRALVHGDIKTSTTRYQKRAKKAAKARKARTEKKNELI